MADSTAVMRHSVVTEVWQALWRLTHVRLDWSGANAAARAQAADEEPVGFVFAGALPTRAVLLEVNHVGFLWCAARSAPHCRECRSLRAAPAAPEDALRGARSRRLTCCIACFVTGALVTGWVLSRIFQRRLELLVRIRAAASCGRRR